MAGRLASVFVWAENGDEFAFPEGDGHLFQGGHVPGGIDFGNGIELEHGTPHNLLLYRKSIAFFPSVLQGDIVKNFTQN